MATVRLCAHCNNPIPAKRNRHNNARYCSIECKDIAGRIRLGNLRPGGPQTGRHTHGTINELLAAADLMRRGYDVYRALCFNSRCDLVAIRGEVILRVEVKTGRYNSAGVGKAMGIHKGQREHCDSIAAVFADGAILYEPPIDVR